MTCMKAPPVSVCLTAYNRAHSIGRSIESLLAQDFADFELIITDDASTDSCEEVCRQYAQLDSRIRYVRNARNVGMPANLNSGLARCRAPLIANLHDGDLFRPDMLSSWKAALDDFPEAAFAFCQLDVLDDDGRYVSTRAPSLPERIERQELVRFMTANRQCFDSPVWGTVMGRRAAYEAVGWFDERFSFIADVAMWIRLNLRYPVAYVQRPLISLTPHEASRPYAYINWHLERALLSMYEEAVDGLCHGDAVAIARERRRIRRLRDRRWLWHLGSCLRRGALDRFEQGLTIFQSEDSLLLRAAGIVGPPVLFVRRRFPVFHRLVEITDFLVRSRRP